MSYFVLRGASRRAKTLTSLALALVMLFQAIGPGVFALRTAYAVPNNNSTGTIKVCKIVLDSEGNNVTGTIGAGTTFTIPWLNESYEGPAVQVLPADAVFTSPFGSMETVFGNEQGKCITYDNLSTGRYYYGEETIGPDASDWEEPIYHDDYVGVVDSYDDLGLFNTDLDEDYDNFDGVINLGSGQTRILVVVNQMKEGDLPDPCLIPNSVSEGDKIVPKHTSPDGTTLQQILDTEYGVNAIVASTSDTGIQYWDIPVGTESVTISGKYINAIAGNKQAFGYYFDGDASSITPIFKNNAAHTASTTLLSPGDSFSVEIDTTGHTKLGFVLDTQGSNPAKHETEKSLNGGEDHAVVFVNPENANGFVIAFEDLVFAAPSDKDYQDLVVEVNIDECESRGDECTPSSGSIVSGTADTKVGSNDGDAAVAVAPIHDAWDATIVDATWVWSENPIADAVATTTESFFHTFTIPGNPASATLDIAADNSYEVYVNGNVVIVADSTENNFGATDSHVLSASAFLEGENVIEFRVTNWRQEGGTMATNPAGLMYKLSWTSNCDNGGGENPYGEQFEVYVAKYLDGAKATAESADEFDFPISTNWNSQAQTPFPAQLGDLDTHLSDTNDYEIVSPEINIHGNYEVMETTGGNVVPIDGECSPGKYRLLGYKVGSSYANAEASALVEETGFFEVTNIESDQYVIVYNESCPTDATIVATKIVCDDESYLPNRSGGANITATTAAEFLADAENDAHCDLAPNWQFQWGPSTVTDPGGAFTGAAGGSWNTTGLTIADGTISFDVPVQGIGDRIWLREVLKADYIPFTAPEDGFPGSNVSAEFYCNTDVLNYDNYEFIMNPVAGQTYYCVAWNVAEEGTNTSPDMVTVTINKFIDGLQATEGAAEGQSFPMVSSWNAVNIGPGNGSYSLGPVGFNSANPYEAVTTDMTSGASYSTSEDLSGPVVGASCEEDKPFALVGYTWGNSYEAAAAGIATTTAPDLTNITSDQYVIVWNESCDGDTTTTTPDEPERRRGGGSSSIVRGSSDSNDDEGLVAGATDLPGLPNTGNGASSQVFMAVLAFIFALVAVNMVGIRLARKS